LLACASDPVDQEHTATELANLNDLDYTQLPLLNNSATKLRK